MLNGAKYAQGRQAGITSPGWSVTGVRNQLMRTGRGLERLGIKSGASARATGAVSYQKSSELCAAVCICFAGLLGGVHVKRRVAPRVIAAAPELAAVAPTLPFDGFDPTTRAGRLPVVALMSDGQQRRLLLRRALADQFEQRGAVQRLDAVGLGEGQRIGRERRTGDIGALFQVMRGHHAKEFAHFPHANTRAVPVLALDDARCVLVPGLQPDIDASIGAVGLAARGKSGLGEEGLAECFEPAPLDCG